MLDYLIIYIISRFVVKDDLRKAYKFSVILGIVMIVNVFLYVLKVVFLFIGRNYAQSYEIPVIGYILLACAIVGFFLIRLLRGMALRSLDTSNMSRKEINQTLVLMSFFTYALCEAVALFGLVVFFLTIQILYFSVFLVLSLLYLRIYFPKYSQWEEWTDYQAFVYQSQGRYSEAESVLTQALEIREKALGPDHLRVAATLNNLAVLYKDQGKYSEAESSCRRSLEIREKALGKDSPAVAGSLNNLALIYQAQGKYSEAEPLYKQSLEMGEKALGKWHPQVGAICKNMAELYRKIGNEDEAERLEARAKGYGRLQMRHLQKANKEQG